MLPLLVLITCAGATAVAASIVMVWASNRSAVWNMVFGAALAVAVIAGALLLALVFTRTALSH